MQEAYRDVIGKEQGEEEFGGFEFLYPQKIIFSINFVEKTDYEQNSINREWF